MTKGERQRHRDRQSKLEYTKESAKQYEVFKSTKKALQVFKELKPAAVGEGLSSLKNSTGSITFSNISGSNLKGLNQILRAPVVETLSNYIKKHGAIKINLDVDFEVQDLKDKELTLFPTRTRQYEFLTEEDIKVGLVQMVAETKMNFENKDLKRSGLILKKDRPYDPALRQVCALEGWFIHRAASLHSQQQKLHQHQEHRRPLLQIRRAVHRA
jgi:hypothetical protein